jgi:hypothetical protein
LSRKGWPSAQGTPVLIEERDATPLTLCIQPPDAGVRPIEDHLSLEPANTRRRRGHFFIRGFRFSYAGEWSCEFRVGATQGADQLIPVLPPFGAARVAEPARPAGQGNGHPSRMNCPRSAKEEGGLCRHPCLSPARPERRLARWR